MEQDEQTPYQKLCYTSVELLVTVGLLGSIADRWPLVAQENWEARIVNLEERMAVEISELRIFAEGFDEEEEN